MKPWITTYTGRHVNPLNIRPEDICIEDVAHHLATQTRWVGAAKEPIYTAAHCFYVVSYIGKEAPAMVRLQGLLHEVPEAYLGDVARMVKQSHAMAGYRFAEHQAWRSTCHAFMLPIALDPIVKEADRAMAGVEAHFAMHPGCRVGSYEGFKVNAETLSRAQSILPWTFMDWRQAKDLFLLMFRGLQAELGR